MDNGQVYAGELIDSNDDFIQVKLTASTGPYVAGQVVLLNHAEITAIG